jgi:hypothetical protein
MEVANVSEGKARPALWGGTVAGLAGGSLLVLFNLLMDLLRGRDPWVGIKLAAYPFVGEVALAPGFDPGPVLQGLTAHLGISVIWGVLFGLAAFGMSRAATVSFGIIWGVVSWIGMSYFVLPLASASVLTRGTPTLLGIAQHLVFGLAIGLGFLPYQRPVVRRTVWAHHLPA